MATIEDIDISEIRCVVHAHTLRLACSEDSEILT